MSWTSRSSPEPWHVSLTRTDMPELPRPQLPWREKVLFCNSATKRKADANKAPYEEAGTMRILLYDDPHASRVSAYASCVRSNVY